MFTDDELLLIHKAIQKGSSITLSDNTKIEVVKSKAGLKQMIFRGVLFIEQNKNKNSPDGELARKGFKITWGIRDGKWIKIMNDKIIER